MSAKSSGRKARELDADTTWAAVRGRETGYDGRFVYAVSGNLLPPLMSIQTSPSQARAFLRDTAYAESAGYRAGRRCRPPRRNTRISVVSSASRPSFGKEPA